MSLKNFFTHVSDVLFPRHRAQCPHCGGVRCMGLCGLLDGPEKETPPAEPAPPEASAEKDAGELP